MDVALMNLTTNQYFAVTAFRCPNQDSETLPPSDGALMGGVGLFVMSISETRVGPTIGIEI